MPVGAGKHLPPRGPTAIAATAAAEVEALCEGARCRVRGRKRESESDGYGRRRGRRREEGGSHSFYSPNDKEKRKRKKRCFSFSVKSAGLKSNRTIVGRFSCCKGVGLKKKKKKIWLSCPSDSRPLHTLCLSSCDASVQVGRPQKGSTAPVIVNQLGASR